MKLGFDKLKLDGAFVGKALNLNAKLLQKQFEEEKNAGKFS